MHFLHTLTLRAMLAMALLCGAGQALAGPVYHVTINTTALAGQSGYLDFLLLGLSGAAPVEASITNFTGNFAASSFATGDASGTVAGGLRIGNHKAWNEFGQWANFGGLFKFDVSFSGNTGNGPGSNLGIALLDAGFNYLGTASDLVTFALQPGTADVVSADAALASVSTVPEPSAALLLALGAAVLLLSRRQRA